MPLPPSFRRLPQDLPRAEAALYAALALLCLLAATGPHLAQPAHYHAFADQRTLWGTPHALDVWSNLPFALAGLAGLWALRQWLPRTGDAQAWCRATAACCGLFFTGLLLTAAGSAAYHWQPEDGTLLWDRAGMLVAFAGVLGLAAAGRIGARPAWVTAGVVLAGGSWALRAWSAHGQLLPWAVLQGGGMLLIAALAFRPTQPGRLAVPLAALIGWYALAKAFELGDHAVWDATGGRAAGHSLKHLAAALAAWPVIAALRRQGVGDARCTMAAAVTPIPTVVAQEHGMSHEQARMEANAHHIDSAAGAAGADAHPNQFALLRQKRFAPFFWTQFAGAANDNLFKFAFTVMVTYQLGVAWMPPSLAGLVIGALFILPFLLFSATAGQLTDKLEKTRLIRFVKNLEIAIMLAAAAGFVLALPALLLGCVFLMGVHSTLFGPVKFALLPQVLHERELTGGNGMVEMGTFVAILLGNVVGGLLVALPDIGHGAVALACVALALAGRLAAQGIPPAPATDPGLVVNWNPFSETWRNLRLAHGNPVVFRSLLGISWMWFFGAVFLSQFPSFAKEVLHGDERVASLLLVVFSIGIGAGALLCEVLSRRQVEIGLVPLGAIGMSVFAIDLYFASRGLPPAPVMGLGAFLAQPAHWRLMADLALLSLFAGLYSVPMYALIQLRSQPTHRARIIAANNILNALFMIASSLIAGALLGAGFTVPQIFLFTGIANAVVALYIFLIVPEYLLRCLAWVLSRCIYRFRVAGDEHIPVQGAAVLACNHVSFVDAVLLMAASPRPIVFMMDHRIFRVPVLGAVFRLARAIPVAPQKEDPAVYEAAFERAAQVLREGDLLGIFPEGGITRDGTLQPFKGGIAKIVERARADGLEPPVIPMALTDLWGSFFSRVEQGDAMVRPFRRGMFNRVGLNVGPPMEAAAITPEALRGRVAQLLERG